MVVDIDGGGDEVEALVASGVSCDGPVGGGGGMLGGRLPPSLLRSAKNCARMSAERWRSLGG